MSKRKLLKSKILCVAYNGYRNVSMKLVINIDIGNNFAKNNQYYDLRCCEDIQANGKTLEC